MSLAGRLDAAPFAAPRHHRSVRSQSAFEDFVPADDAAAVFFEESLGPADHVALQPFFSRVLPVGLEMVVADALLAFRAFFPLRLRALVASDVDVLRGEEFYYLREHILDEGERAVVAGAEHVVRDAPHFPYLIGAARAAQFGVGRKGRLHVAGEVDFGDDGDVASGRVVHDAADVLLRVETAVGYAVVASRVVSDDRFGALRADFGEARVFLDFYAPALVVGDVPVETVDVVQGQHVDEAAHRIGGHEVARHVEVRPAVGEARRIVHLGGGDDHALCRTHGQRLAEGLDGVEETRGGCSVEPDNFAVHADVVGFGVLVLERTGELDTFALHGHVRQRHLQPRGLVDVVGEELRVAFQLLVARGVGNEGLFVEFKIPRLCSLHLFGKRNHVEVRILGMNANQVSGEPSRDESDNADGLSHSV